MSDLSMQLNQAAIILKEKYFRPKELVELHADELTDIFKEVKLINGHQGRARARDLRYKMHPYCCAKGFVCAGKYRVQDWLVITDLRTWLSTHTRTEMIQDRLECDKYMLETTFSYLTDMTPMEKYLYDDMISAREETISAGEVYQLKRERWIKAITETKPKDDEDDKE